MMNKSKGNMYEDVKTWNGMYGICPHNCLYCYNRRYWGNWGEMRFNERAFKTNLGSGKVWFIGSSCDMFADKISREWIIESIKHLQKYPKNTYLLQSKNPKRFLEFVYPNLNVILGTTIETDKDELILKYSDAPLVKHRKYWMCQLPNSTRKFVTIEPIMKFDLHNFVEIIKEINPKFVYVGADSKQHRLNEPSSDKIIQLIDSLKGFTQVRVKSNLHRLCPTLKNGTNN